MSSGKQILISLEGVSKVFGTDEMETYTLNGTRVDQMKLSQRARVRNREIGFIFQAFNLIGDLTVYENSAGMNRCEAVKERVI